MESSPKKAEVESELLTGRNMFLVVEKGMRGGICYSIYWYVEANNKYMKDCHPGKIISFLTFWDTNNLYECVMSQKLHVDGFE